MIFDSLIWKFLFPISDFSLAFINYFSIKPNNAYSRTTYMLDNLTNKKYWVCEMLQHTFINFE